jgi:hypothetical protein
MSLTRAQSVELLYTKAGLDDALEYKGMLSSSRIEVTNALSLMEMNDAGRGAYVRNTSSMTAVIIVGKGALQAVSKIDYHVPVIVIDAVDRLSAKGPILRVLNAGFKKVIGSVIVKNIDALEITSEQLHDGKETFFQCEGVLGGQVVNKLVEEIAKRRSHSLSEAQ